MAEIDFSVMEGQSGDASKLLPLLDAFEKQYDIHVNLIGIPWNRGWMEIAKFGIYSHGPDVSAIGTTWIASLAAMQALRPFTQQQVRALGGADAFFQSSWRTGFLPDDPSVWAIPWLGDAIVINYWEDALEKAGIRDFKAALATDTALVNTLEKLRKSGMIYPLALNITNIEILLHEAAHWMWSAGGDFISPDGRQAIFNQPAAMQGWKNYFSLQPFISPDCLGSISASGDAFLAGEAAIQMGGPYLALDDMLQRSKRYKHLEIALAPETAYIGGASFVIWKYSFRNHEAFELVRFLSSQPTRIPGSPHSQALPTRSEAMHMPSVETNIFHRTCLQALQNGRSFPSIRLWGTVEEKLVLEISRIWAELFAEPDQDLDTLLHKHLDPLAKQLSIVLGN